MFRNETGNLILDAVDRLSAEGSREGEASLTFF